MIVLTFWQKFNAGANVREVGKREGVLCFQTHINIMHWCILNMYLNTF